MMRIEEATAGDQEQLDAFAFQSRNRLIYYSVAYRKFLHRVIPGVQSAVLVARFDGELAGFLPYWIQPDREFGGVLNSQPFFGSHGGALTKDDVAVSAQAAAALYSALGVVAVQRSIAAMTIVENPFQPLTPADQAAAGTECADYRIAQFTTLPASEPVEDHIFARLHLKTRNAVRKGRKAGVEISEDADPATVRSFQRMHQESITSLGGVPKSLEVFEALFDLFSPEKAIRLYVGRKNGELVCGVLVLLYGDTVEYYTPVVSAAHRESQVLSALIVDVMVRVTREGYRMWNWGGTWPSQEGVYRFKSRWGAEQCQYRYHTRVFHQGIRSLSKEQVLARFPSFYVFPFS